MKQQMTYSFLVIIIATSVSILAINILQDILWPPPVPEVKAEPSLQGGLRLDLQPLDTVGWLSGQGPPLSNQETIKLEEGLYQLTLVAPGYRTKTQQIEIKTHSLTTVRGFLMDEQGPKIKVKARPVVARVDEPLRLEASLADEGRGVKSYEFMVDGRSWKRWQELFSAFVEPPYSNNKVEVRGAGVSLGLKRTFDPEQAPGVKIFLWGQNAPLDVIGGSQVYYEIWGGLTPTFDQFLTIQPQQSVGWTETWTLIY